MQEKAHRHLISGYYYAEHFSSVYGRYTTAKGLMRQDVNKNKINIHGKSVSGNKHNNKSRKLPTDR